MLRRTETTSGIIVYIVVIIAWACCGVGLGLVRAWPEMGLSFVCTIYFAEGCAVTLLKRKLKSRFKKLGELITGKSFPDRLAGEFVSNSILVCMIIAVAEMIFLSMLAYKRELWLAFGVLLAALLITNTFFMSFIICLKIKACAGYLEEVVSNNKESTTHTESKKF